MNASQILAQNGYSVTEAAEWLMANLSHPGEIYATTKALGLSNAMLAELLTPHVPGVNADEVDAFFSAHGITTAAAQLAKYQLSVSEAQEWITAHLDKPLEIYAEAQAAGLTGTMLAEILSSGMPGVTGAEVDAFFKAHGAGGQTIPPITTPNPPLTGSMVGDLMSTLSGLLTLNEEKGVLSNASLRAEVLKLGVSDAQYEQFFSPKQYAGYEDGVLTARELGLPGQASMAATAENLEALYLGTMVTAYRAIDKAETQSVEDFYIAHAFPQYGSETYQQWLNLVVDAYSTPAAPGQRTLNDAQIAEVISEDIKLAIELSGTGRPVLDAMFSSLTF